jgi:hypothetical protein
MLNHQDMLFVVMVGAKHLVVVVLLVKKVLAQPLADLL